MTDAPFQPMPPLSPEQYDALRRDIEANGVTVPVVVDQHGRLLDGHNRSQIAADLGIALPSETRHVADDDEAMSIAVTLNCARRHLTREQVRAVVAGELSRHPSDSDRAIARRVGCSPSTVGAVRRPVSKLDSKAAEQRSDDIEEALKSAREHLFALVCVGHVNDIPAAEMATALVRARKRFDRNHSEGDEALIADVFRIAVFEPVLDLVLESAIEHIDIHGPRLDEAGKAGLLADIETVGGD